ncbi:LacI family DNA-binding transcriptional regulator [Parafilimonas terrae]|jgi:LacI family transcriptional regulator|uniref:Transcriptional regulator, LacI family n=1 Tax=Parafilimonas terrae TaxID=1465490 RepID=A0A1I5Y2U3_9BACT|nr:LacI family DNA-binding transcriptional regulator [Parafilimonas terrae]SFQ38420.1 transcriptional regulator, LacI family [Parafilimonas terrae]
MNIKILAEQLNLSISTVSRALRDSYEISEPTKARVRAMAKQLNYRINPYASSLRRHRSKTIAVLIPEITNNFFSQVINGIEYIAQEKNYHILIYITHEDVRKEIEFAHHLHNGRVDGVLMSVSAETNNYDHLNELMESGVPIVFFDRICESIETSSIITDDFESGFAATEHLFQCGCRRIGFFGLFEHLSISRKRYEGYLAALKKYGINKDDDLIVRSGNDIAANEAAITKVLTSANKPDGAFASIEKMAIASYNVCKRLDIDIPSQLKLISFSNLEISTLLNPSLTTITQPAYEIGKQAAMQLFRYLEKKLYMNRHEKIVLKSSLIPRQSTKKTHSA